MQANRGARGLALVVRLVVLHDCARPGGHRSLDRTHPSPVPIGRRDRELGGNGCSAHHGQQRPAPRVSPRWAPPFQASPSAPGGGFPWPSRHPTRSPARAPSASCAGAPRSRSARRSRPPPATVALLIEDNLDEGALGRLRRIVRSEGARAVLVVGTIRETELLDVIECGVGAIVWRREATAHRLVQAVLAAHRGDGDLPADLLGRLISQVGTLHRGAASTARRPLPGTRATGGGRPAAGRRGPGHRRDRQQAVLLRTNCQERHARTHDAVASAQPGARGGICPAGRLHLTERAIEGGHAGSMPCPAADPVVPADPGRSGARSSDSGCGTAS